MRGLDGQTADYLRRAITAEGIRIAGTISAGSIAIDEFPAAAALSDTFANPTTTSVASMGMLWNGTTWQRAKSDGSGALLVNPGALSSATDSVTAVTNSETTNGSAVPAKGQLIAGSDGTNARNISTDTTGKLNLSAVGTSNSAIPTQSILIGHRGADENLRALKGNDQGDGQSTGVLATGGWAFNGTDSDKVRNNIEATVLASATRATTTNSTDQTNHNGRGVMLILNATANPGGGETLSLKLQAKDPISSAYIDVADAGVLLTAANGTKALVVYPGVLAADFVSGTVGKSAVVPRVWRAVVTH